jgi:pyruvate formate lyase activating enzyme
MVIDRQRCTVCGLCMDACPAAAVEVIGREWTADALYAEVAKDRAFYETSGGGVTVSGGEPLMQPEFVEDLLALCREGGIATALDTCGHADWRHFEAVLPFVDMVLFDLKLIDRERHHAATGVYPERILANAQRLGEAGLPMWVRTPIIPGFTDDEENIAALAAFIRGRLPNVVRWDLLAFNNLGRPKYTRLSLPYPLDGAELVTREQMERLHTLAAAAVGGVARWSGATRL